MPELSDVLAAEAARRQPTHQPTFDALVRARRQRDRRHQIAGALVVLAAAGGVAGGVTLRGTSGIVSRIPPGGSGSTSTVVAVTGVLEMVGGPPGAPSVGVSGTVVFEAANGQRISTHAVADGRFSVALAPGRYTVTGTSPQYGDGQGVCRTDGPVMVAPGHQTDIVVACDRR